MKEFRGSYCGKYLLRYDYLLLGGNAHVDTGGVDT